jgi:hypothetical protein
MANYRFDDTLGPEDYGWDKELFDVFRETVPRDIADNQQDYNTAALFFEHGFAHSGKEEQYIHDAREWFFQWMEDHNLDPSGFDWDEWRDWYDETYG